MIKGVCLMKRSLVLVAFISGALMVLVGCGDDEEAPPGPPPQPNEVAFTAVDTEVGHRFTGPETLTAGWTAIRLVNESEGHHHLQLVKLPEGMTAEELVDVAQKPGPPPPGVEFLGGPGTLVPGGDGVATVNLQEGSYVLLCLEAHGDGAPHFAKGLWKSLTVTAATGTPAPEPQEVAIIGLSDSEFTITGSVPAGVQTVRVTNIGQQPHEAILLRLAPDASVRDYPAPIIAPAPAGIRRASTWEAFKSSRPELRPTSPQSLRPAIMPSSNSTLARPWSSRCNSAETRTKRPTTVMSILLQGNGYAA